MNTLKFSKIENELTERHNLEIEGSQTITLNGQEVTLNTPCNLCIFITNRCPNQCEFCINRNSWGTDISTSDYFTALENVLSKLDNRYTEITITGGEPTLVRHRLVRTLEICHEMGFKFRTFSTTGLNLMEQVFFDKRVCDYMIQYDCKYNINITRLAIDEQVNKKLFNGKGVLTNEEIKRLAMFYQLNDADMRLSCNLMHDGVHDMTSMLEYITQYDYVDSIIFRELIASEKILLSDILDTSIFEYIDSKHSDYYDVDIYKYDKKWLVKHYTNKPKTTNIETLSLSNGILCNNYTGDKIKIDCVHQKL